LANSEPCNPSGLGNSAGNGELKDVTHQCLCFQNQLLIAWSSFTLISPNVSKGDQIPPTVGFLTNLAAEIGSSEIVENGILFVLRGT